MAAMSGGAAPRMSPTMRLLLADIVRDGPTYTEKVEWVTVRALWRRRLIQQLPDGRWRATPRGVQLIMDLGEPESAEWLWARARPIVAGPSRGAAHLVEPSQVGTGQAALCGMATSELAQWARPTEDDPDVVCLRCARLRKQLETRR